MSPEARTPAAFKSTATERSTPPSSSFQSIQLQNTARRRAAAEWVHTVTTVNLPTSSDNAFRRALRDGELLCKLLNTIRPGILPKVSTVFSCTAGCASSLKLLSHQQCAGACSQSSMLRHVAGSIACCLMLKGWLNPSMTIGKDGSAGARRRGR